MIVVTGSTGFVGTVLCRQLARRGIAYRAVTRTRSANPTDMPVGNISSRTEWRAALEAADTIVHLAARVHVMRETNEDALTAFRAVNLDASLNLARHAAASGVRRLVYVSSIKVNGEATAPGKPFRHDDNPNPLDPYGVSKLEAERALADIARESALELVIVRPPLVYGPGVGANFGLLIQWVRRGMPLPLGAVHNRRSLVFVENLVDLLITVTTSPDASGQVFLVSDGSAVSTTELLRELSRATGAPNRLVPVPAGLLRLSASALGRTAIANRLLGSLELDIEPTRSALGWSPPFSFESGIAATVSPANTIRSG